MKIKEIKSEERQSVETGEREAVIKHTVGKRREKPSKKKKRERNGFYCIPKMVVSPLRFSWTLILSHLAHGRCLEKCME